MTNYTEDNRKHFDYLQSIISRMNENSFLIKGWTVTIVSALMALAASSKEWQFLAISILPIIIFWYLDAYYLSQERKFRQFYNKAIEAGSTIQPYDLNYNTEDVKKTAKNNLRDTAFSPTLGYFYFTIIGAVIAVIILFMLFSGTKPKEEGDVIKIELSVSDSVITIPLKVKSVTKE